MHIDKTNGYRKESPMKNNKYLRMIAISFLLVVAIAFAIYLAELGNTMLYILIAADVISSLAFVTSTAMMSRIHK